MSDIEKHWNEALELLRGEIMETAIETWIAPLRPKMLDEKNKKLYVEADEQFVVQRLNERYLQILEQAVSTTFKDKINVVAEVALPKERPTEEEEDVPIDLDEELSGENYLNPRFSFDNFVVGSNSEFAYSAAMAVAESPSTKYNPLFLYGGSGLGKTHLMHAIGHYILKHNENLKVLYVSSETFTNELIMALRAKKMTQFKDKYRKIDVLLIDDIQFLEGKDSTMEEFFFTFDSLYNNNKQIIISSDKPPQQLNGLDERLTSRFLWSITADIQPPSYETRVAILLNKAKNEDIEITPDLKNVINLIAERVKYNVRELEGALSRIITFSTLMNKPIDIPFAKETLKDIFSSSDFSVSITTVKRSVAKYYGITIKDMDSSKRVRSISYPRQIAMYLSKEMTDSSLPKIAAAFGGKNHTSVLYACNKIKQDLETDEELKNQVKEIKMMME